MSDKYILAIDQGTTGTTVLLVNHEGKFVSRAYEVIEQYYPKSGWVEHGPDDIWRKTLSATESALQAAGTERNQIDAVGITNQRETTIVWDKNTGNPIRNAIVWQCRRTAGMCEELRDRGLAEKIKRRTGLVIDPYFSATKLAWILDNVDGLRDDAERGNVLFGTVDTWLLWNLTGGKVHATDYTNASRTMLFNIHSLAWDEGLLDELNIPTAILPEVFPSSGIFGVVDCGSEILDGIPISGVAGDQQAALFGQGCWMPGTIKNTYGTGCFLMLNTGRDAILSESGLLTTIACGKGGSPVYALEGSVFIAGAAVQWLRDEMHLIENASETELIAKSIPDTDGVYIVPAFAGLGAPYWDADARGAIFGITRGTGREHIVRAALEAIAYQTADVMEAMRADSGQEIGKLRVDGGASANNFLMQFQSDILRMKVDRPVVKETTALGAAFLAGLAVGFWEDESQLEKCRETDVIFRPELTPKRRAELLLGWHEAVNKTMYKK